MGEIAKAQAGDGSHMELRREDGENELIIVPPSGSAIVMELDPGAVKVLGDGFEELEARMDSDGDVSGFKGGMNRVGSVREGVNHRLRWEIMEVVRENEPTTIRHVAEQVDRKPSSIRAVLSRLRERGYVRAEDNDVFPGSRAKIVLYLGGHGERFLEKFDADSFLYPDNPYDPLPDGSRMEEIQRMKLDGRL